LYVNGRALSPRDKNTLNVNVDYWLGIEGFELEDMERRLKADVLRAIYAGSGTFSFYHQMDNMTNALEQETAAPHTVHTLKEIFTNMKGNFPQLLYYRVPITDECAPEEQDIDSLIDIFKAYLDAHNRNAIIFNCQMGRGRTTTGMVCARLFYMLKRNGARNRSPSGTAATLAPRGVVEEAEAVSEEERLKRGWYNVVKRLVSHIDNGLQRKREVDEAIDACAHMQNLRHAIYECKAKMPSCAEAFQREVYEKRGKNYLERYWWLIIYNTYLHAQGPQGFKKSFSNWMKGHWHMKHTLKRLELA